MRILATIRRLRESPEVAASELLGCCDDAVLRTAIDLRNSAEKVTLTVVAAGTAALEDEILHLALSRGADRVVRIDEPRLETADFLGVARALSAAARHIGYDIVLAGDRSENERQGEVGPAMAEWLSLPHLTEVRSVSLGNPGDRSVLATRRDGGVIRTLRIPLPCLLTIASYPRISKDEPTGRPTSAGEVERLTLKTLNIRPEELRHRDICLGTLQPTSPMAKAIMFTDPELLVSRLRDDRLLD